MESAEPQVLQVNEAQSATQYGLRTRPKGDEDFAGMIQRAAANLPLL